MSPEEVTKIGEGWSTGHVGEARKLGLFSLREGSLEETSLPPITSFLEDSQKMETDSSHKCTVTER